MTMKNQLTIAVIGVGAMGQAHCATIGEHVPELRLAAVVDAHVETAASAGARYRVAHFTTVEAMLDAGGIEAALVAVPHPLHADVAIACLQAGLHVLCEKPLTERVSTSDAMLAAARVSGVTLGVNFQRRFDPAIRAAIDFAHNGGIGRIMRTHLVVPEFRTQRYFDTNPWRATWQGEGGGVLLNQAAHMLDVFVQVAGLPVSLLARVETRLHDIEVEDTAEALLRYADGGSGYLYCSTTEPPAGEALEVHGEEGVLVYHAGRVTCARYPAGVGAFARDSAEVWGKPAVESVGAWMSDGVPHQDAVLRNFTRHILYGEPFKCDAASGMASLELANAITLSSFTEREETLPVDRAAYDALLAHLRATANRHKPVVETARITDPKFMREPPP